MDNVPWRLVEAAYLVPHVSERTTSGIDSRVSLSGSIAAEANGTGNGIEGYPHGSNDGGQGRSTRGLPGIQQSSYSLSGCTHKEGQGAVGSGSLQVTGADGCDRPGQTIGRCS